MFFFQKMYLYFSAGNGQPREPALCQLYRHTFVLSDINRPAHVSRSSGKGGGRELARYTIVISLCFRLHSVLCSFLNYSCVDLLVFCSTPTHSTWRRHAKCVFVCMRISRGEYVRFLAHCWFTNPQRFMYVTPPARSHASLSQVMQISSQFEHGPASANARCSNCKTTETLRPTVRRKLKAKGRC